MNNWKWFNPDTTDTKLKGVDVGIISDLDAARQQTVDEDPDKKGIPMVITSGLRTPDQETALRGGVKDSSHLAHDPNGTALGIDMQIPDDRGLAFILAGLFARGFRRIGLYYTKDAQGNHVWHHLHADKDPALPGFAVWLKEEQN